MPVDGDLKSQKAAEENHGVTCEACHGPGSKHIESQAKDPNTIIGKPDASICTNCHNRRKPYNSGPEYHFDYQKEKAKGVH